MDQDPQGHSPSRAVLSQVLAAPGTHAFEADDLLCALGEHCVVSIEDPAGVFVHVNDRFCSLARRTREELVGQNSRILNSGYHSKEFFSNLWNTIQNGRVWRGDLRNRAGDGSLYWVDATIVPTFDLQGQPRQYVCIATDITERKKTETAASQLAAIVTSSDDAIVGKDLRGIVTSWNAGAERIFGYSEAEMIGQPIRRLIPGDRQIEEERILATIARGETVRHFDTVRVRKDGTKIPVSVTVSAIRDFGGRIVGASKVAREISDRKRAENTIRKLNASLEQRVAERTAQLEAANRELEAFSYSVSHDLRAPLRAIDGFSQAVVEDFGALLPPEGQRYLETIRASARRMGALIDDLLTFARLNRLEMKRQPIDTAALVHDCLEELGAPWPDRKVDVRVAELIESSGDPSLLKQVWLNLLSNALKYSRNREHATIEIGSTGTRPNPIFFVRDNGAGFDMRYADKLFGVFQRLHHADEFEGTGVGLAIVQRIVTRHGGRIWAEAGVDKGATFFFTL